MTVCVVLFVYFNVDVCINQVIKTKIGNTLKAKGTIIVQKEEEEEVEDEETEMNSNDEKEK